MSKKGLFFSALLVFGVIAILCICCFAFFAMIGSISDYESTDNIVEEVIQKGDYDQEIAVIDIEGMIASNQDSLDSGDMDMVDIILAKLEKAQNDDNVKAIIIRLNTPGGTVYDSHVISQKVKEINREKPVVAYMGMSATSGGYYISAPASEIIASETTVTGSIGVIVQVSDLDGLYEKLGINVYSITNTQGDVKSMDNLEDPDSEDRDILLQVLDDNYESFISEVMDGRDMTREEVIAIADGSIYSGTTALELGLVDELGEFDQAVDAASKLADLDDPKVVEYNTYIDPFSNFSLFVSNELNPIKSYTNKISEEPGMYMYYMPEL